LDVCVDRLSFITCGPKVDDLDDRAFEVLEEDVFWFQITMYEARLVQQSKPVQQLLREDTDQCRAETSKLVLFDQFVQIDAKQLEYETQMLSMDERVFQA
jgi:hypothetical protein